MTFEVQIFLFVFLALALQTPSSSQLYCPQVLSGAPLAPSRSTLCALQPSLIEQIDDPPQLSWHPRNTWARFLWSYSRLTSLNYPWLQYSNFKLHQFSVSFRPLPFRFDQVGPWAFSSPLWALKNLDLSYRATAFTLRLYSLSPHLLPYSVSRVWLAFHLAWQLVQLEGPWVSTLTLLLWPWAQAHELLTTLLTASLLHLWCPLALLSAK